MKVYGYMPATMEITVPDSHGEENEDSVLIEQGDDLVLVHKSQVDALIGALQRFLAESDE